MLHVYMFVMPTHIFISSPMISRAKTSLYSKSTQKAIFWIQGPQNRWGPHGNIFKRLIYPFSQRIGPRGGAFYQISPDVALTTCIQLYSERTRNALFRTFIACSLDAAFPK